VEVPYFHSLFARYGERARFVMIYGREAHAADEWPIGSKLKYNQHTTPLERARAAKDFIEHKKLNWPVVMDTLRNDFDDVFAAWPVRLYIVHKGRLVYKAQPKGAGYDFTEVGSWLANHFGEVAETA